MSPQVWNQEFESAVDCHENAAGENAEIGALHVTIIDVRHRGLRAQSNTGLPRAGSERGGPHSRVYGRVMREAQPPSEWAPDLFDVKAIPLHRRRLCAAVDGFFGCRCQPDTADTPYGRGCELNLGLELDACPFIQGSRTGGADPSGEYVMEIGGTHEKEAAVAAGGAVTDGTRVYPKHVQPSLGGDRGGLQTRRPQADDQQIAACVPGRPSVCRVRDLGGTSRSLRPQGDGFVRRGGRGVHGVRVIRTSPLRPGGDWPTGSSPRLVAPVGRDASWPGRPVGSNEGQAMKVLVVEDDEFTRTLLVGAVASLGHECIAAVDGLHGWSHIQTSPPDMVISDWHMPGMDGLELCMKVRSLEPGKPVYFLLMVGEEHRHDALQAMEGGVDDYVVKPVDLDELHGRLVLARRWVQLHRELAARADEVEILKVQLRESAERDPLTMSYNTLRLAEDMAAITDRMARYEHHYAVALFDIDHFKAYNDTYGHIAGDEALIHVAELIGQQRRAGDALYRYGGEEFLLLLPEQTADGARTAAERIRGAVAGTPVHHRHLDVDGHVTVSVGIADLRPGGRAFEEALHRADNALQAAKQHGRNRVVVAQDASSAAGPEIER